MLDDVVRLATAEGDADRLAKAHVSLADVARRRGDKESADEQTDRSLRWRLLATMESVVAQATGAPTLWTALVAVRPDGSLALLDAGEVSQPRAAPSEVERLRRSLGAAHAERAVVASSALSAPVNQAGELLRPGPMRHILLVHVVTVKDVHTYTADLPQEGDAKPLYVWRVATTQSEGGPHQALVAAVRQALAPSPPRSGWRRLLP